MKGRCADENHARTRKTRFLYDWLSSYQFTCLLSRARGDLCSFCDAITMHPRRCAAC